jgi:UDP-N-acetylmuramoyl-tripeptide--D-alanyl-D-alanine ligase
LKQLFKLLITKLFVRQTNKILARYKPKIVVVAGSIGKTSTKIAIAKILSGKYRVQYEEGNYNVPISVPFVVTGQRLPNLTSISGWIRAYHKGRKMLKNGFNYDVVVLEYSIDHIGEMDEFRHFPVANYVVLTAIAPEHMENLVDIETVAKEELKVTNYANTVIYNLNTVNKKFIEKYGQPNAAYESYGESKSSTYVQNKIRSGSNFTLELSHNNIKIASTSTKMIARHSLDALSAATIVANKFGLTENEINFALQAFSNPSGRMNILEGKQNSLIIDDSYNSSPEAVIAALEALYEIKGKQKIAILGNMNELGDFSEEAHRAVGHYCDPKKLDLLITIGPDANRYLAEAAKSNGCQVITTKSPVEAGTTALKQIKPNSIFLIKGSQNKVFSEEAIKLLLSNPKDSQKLVRQSNYWMNIKRNQFSDIS